jgi:hypothetical protein
MSSDIQYVFVSERINGESGCVFVSERINGEIGYEFGAEEEITINGSLGEAKNIELGDNISFLRPKSWFRKEDETITFIVEYIEKNK